MKVTVQREQLYNHTYKKNVLKGIDIEWIEEEHKALKEINYILYQERHDNKK